jgi:hypothetical protein
LEGGLVGHTGLLTVMVIEPEGNVTVDKVDDKVLAAAGGIVVVLLSKQMGQSPHCRLVSFAVLVLIRRW